MARIAGSAEQTERRRNRAIQIVFKEKRTQSIAAAEAGVHLRSVQKWVNAYRKLGPEGLKSRKAPGRPKKLNPKQIKVLEGVLLQGAKIQGYANDLWTSKRILKMIERLTGVSYHHNHVPRLLRAMGWSVQRPQREAAEKDPKKIDEWIRVEWRRIKKKPAAKKPRSSS
jgi:transposase